MSNIDVITGRASLEKLSVLEEFGDRGSTHAICHFSSCVAIRKPYIFGYYSVY